MMRLLHWVLAPRTVPALPRTFPREWGAPPDAATLAALGVAEAATHLNHGRVARHHALSRNDSVGKRADKSGRCKVRPTSTVRP